MARGGEREARGSGVSEFVSKGEQGPGVVGSRCYELSVIGGFR